jgi:hypothetical protein
MTSNLSRWAQRGPKTKHEARRWIRLHWAYLIDHADMGAVGELENDALDAVWSDECRKIANRLRRAASTVEGCALPGEEDFPR